MSVKLTALPSQPQLGLTMTYISAPPDPGFSERGKIPLDLLMYMFTAGIRVKFS